jgi:ABC-type transport system involved in multi-copper enzyme maturation permease subunit
MKMTNFDNIRSVAKYESKLLMRSWFYRIFSILAILFLGLFQFVVLISDSNINWIAKAIASNIPYSTILLLNTAQAVVAVFLSSEFLKADKKLDTSEVFYVHPLSNAEYVAGKIWGNMRVFIRLDLTIMAIVAVINLASGVQFDWLSYIIYFFIICVPTLIFIFGLSVGLMLILKNQAITFVILLGYIALTLFYIGDKFYYVFDYMTYVLPLMKSSIVGFTSLSLIINHRLIYLLLGLGFLCVSIYLFRRLPNTKASSFRWLVVAIVFIIAGSIAVFNHVRVIISEVNARTEYTAVNNKYVELPKMTVSDYDISVEQLPESIVADVIMRGVAGERAQKFVFCLNPALEVKEVKTAGRTLAFERDKQILLVDFGRQVDEGDSLEVAISYSGRIDGGFCYLDIPAKIMQSGYSNMMFQIDKKYCFQTGNYVLFTPETYWYPSPGTSYSNENPDWQQSYFSNFSLTVKTLPGLKALSQGTPQGALENTEDSTSVRNSNLFAYKTDFPTPSISLIIGDYEQKSIEVDSTLYSIWYIKGHDYFTATFDSIIDTIPAQIREQRRSIESAYSLNYSFRRFSIVEVPVQFFSYTHAWSQAQEKMQPEMALYPEKGCIFDDADVVRRAKNEKQWGSWNGQEVSDVEAAIRTFNNFAWTFRRTESNFNFQVERGEANVSTQANPYFIFPQLYNFRYNIFSSDWTIANRLIELYLQDKTDNNNWMRQTNGISNDEKANLLMEKYPFKALLSDVEQRDILDNVISLKAKALFAIAERNVGYQEFRDSLRAYLKENIFSNLRFESLLDTMGAIAGEDLLSPLQQWSLPTKLPVYILRTPVVTRITNRDMEVYVVKLLITNDSDNDGIINVEITMGGRNVVYDPYAKRKVSINAHETKELVSIWDEAPRNITINTLISANLPGIVNLQVSNILRERNKTIDIDGDFVVNEVASTAPGEVIVDNEDSTLFELSKPDVVGLLPQWLEGVADNSFRYAGVSPWRPPLQWTLTTNDRYYGLHVRSAYVVKSGSGSQTATWKIPVPSAGQYELYYYLTKGDDGRRGGGGGRGGGGPGNRGEDIEYKFKVKYDNDVENTYINFRSANDGWTLLGTYYFNQDTVGVILTNECKQRSVIADAVKIVKK